MNRNYKKEGSPVKLLKGLGEKIGKMKEKRAEKMAGKAEAAGMSLDQYKAERKDKLKQSLADAFGGGQRGLFTQTDPGLERMREERADQRKKDMFNIGKTVGGPDAQVGGGSGTSDTSADRTDMPSNATMAFRKKKGYNW